MLRWCVDRPRDTLTDDRSLGATQGIITAAFAASGGVYGRSESRGGPTVLRHMSPRLLHSASACTATGHISWGARPWLAAT
jgi:hypothetical protein